MKQNSTSYLLWACCFMGLFGLHRFYAGKTLSGFVWLFTLGLLGFGQLFDLFAIPGMVRETNVKRGYTYG